MMPMDERPDPLDPLNVGVEQLRARLLRSEQANLELLRLMRITGQGAWRSPMTIAVLLVAFAGAAVVGDAYAHHRRVAQVERIE
jgi:hypothetical protein